MGTLEVATNQENPGTRTALSISTSALLAVCAAVLGCGEATDARGCLECPLLDEHNVPLEMTMDAEATPLQQQQDARLRWQDLGSDLFTRPVADCAEIEDVVLYTFPSTSQAEILEGLANGDLQQSAISSLWTCPPVDCECSLTDCSYVGHPFVPASDFVGEAGTWLLTLSGGSRPGIRALAFPVPAADGGGDELVVTDATSIAVVHAELAQDVEVGAGQEITLDWSALEHDVWGGELAHHRLDHLQLDRLDLPAADVADRLLDLDADSLERWQGAVDGRTDRALADLDGPRPFPGVEPGETWLVTIWCKSCLFDLPRVVVFLQPAG